MQAVSWEGYAPVHAAAAYGRVSVMHMLLTFGADAKAATPEGVRDRPLPSVLMTSLLGRNGHVPNMSRTSPVQPEAR